MQNKKTTQEQDMILVEIRILLERYDYLDFGELINLILKKGPIENLSDREFLIKIKDFMIQTEKEAKNGDFIFELGNGNTITQTTLRMWYRGDIKKAIEDNKTNKNCHECVNSNNLVDCYQCDNSSYSTKCFDSSYMERAYNCYYCRGVKNSSDEWFNKNLILK